MTSTMGESVVGIAVVGAGVGLVVGLNDGEVVGAIVGLTVGLGVGAGITMQFSALQVGESEPPQLGGR